MSALEWRKKFGQPKLVHDTSGLVCVELAGRVIVFPCEASARFFYEACSELPATEAAADTLAQWIDEAALHKAEARAVAAESQVSVLQAEGAVLKAKLAQMAETASKASRRARVLAIALQNGIKP